jgi:hypothetical protein
MKNVVKSGTPTRSDTILDYVDSSAALLLVNPDDTLQWAAKAMIRQQSRAGLFVWGLHQLLFDERAQYPQCLYN